MCHQTCFCSFQLLWNLPLSLLIAHLVAIRVPAGCGSAQLRPLSRMLLLPSWSIQLWEQISTHAPFSLNMSSVPDCHPVHLLVPCHDTCHRLAARQPVVNRWLGRTLQCEDVSFNEVTGEGAGLVWGHQSRLWILIRFSFFFFFSLPTNKLQKGPTYSSLVEEQPDVFQAEFQTFVEFGALL